MNNCIQYIDYKISKGIHFLKGQKASLNNLGHHYIFSYEVSMSLCTVEYILCDRYYTQLTFGIW